MQATAITLRITTAGMVALVMVKIEPNRICVGAPVVVPPTEVR